MRKVFILILLLITIISVSVSAENIKSVKVVSEEWVDCTNSDGTGLYFDLLRLVCNSRGIGVDVSIRPYARSTQMVEKGQADVVIGPYIDEISNVIYPEYPFSGDRVVALTRKGVVDDWQGEDSIKGKKVAWIRGYSFGDYINVPMNASEIGDRRQGIRMLQAKRIDFLIDAPSDIEDTIKKMKLNRSDFEMKDVEMLHMYTCFVKSAKGEELAKIWDEEFPKRVKSGEVKELFKKYNCLSDYEALVKSYQF